MEKYFASHIFEENVNGAPIEVLPMSPQDKWADDRRWTTAASINGAKKNIRAKIKAALGYNWKEIQHVDMIFGPVKKETYLGIYNVPAENVKAEEENVMSKTENIGIEIESAVEKEENKMNDIQGRETQVVNPYDEMVGPGREPDRAVDLKVFAMYNGKKGYVNRTTTFWTKEPDFYVGNVFKNGVKVGSWTWNLEFKYPQYKPVAGSLGGDGATAFNYAYPNDMKKMETNEERINRTNCNGYLVAITVALAKVGIKTKYQPKNSNYGASVMDSSGPAPRTVTGHTHKKPEEPVVVNTGIDENDLAFYE